MELEDLETQSASEPTTMLTPEQMINDDLLTEAGRMLQFIEGCGLAREYHDYEVADSDAIRRTVLAQVNMRLSPRL